MAGLIAPNVGRFAIEGSYGGQPVAHVLDFIPSIVTGEAPGRPEFMELTAEALATHWPTLIEVLPNYLVYDQVTYVDLDSANGPVGSFTPSAPITGGASGTLQAMPGNVAARFDKIAAVAQRGQRAGRLYLPGVWEGATTAASVNTLDAGWRTDFQADADAFFDALDAPLTHTNGSFAPTMVVTHTRRPEPDEDPVFNGYSVVSGLSLRARLASQRRRLTP